MSLQQNFFKLLIHSNDLKKHTRDLQKEDPASFEVLLKFLVTIEDNFHYFERREYVNLVKNFLNNKITADDFSYSFIAIYEGINKKLDRMVREESPDLAIFLNKAPRPELNRLLARVYGLCDSFSLDSDFSISDEKELKNYAKILLTTLQYK